MSQVRETLDVLFYLTVTLIIVGTVKVIRKFTKKGVESDNNY